MLKIVLISGPRGAGKTTYAKKMAKSEPDTYLFCRDTIMIQYFGKNTFDPYTENPFPFLRSVLKETIERCVSISKRKDVTLIVDWFTGYNHQRFKLLDFFKKIAPESETVILLADIGHDECVRRFYEREGKKGGWNPSHDYHLYQETIQDFEKINSEREIYHPWRSFDRVGKVCLDTGFLF
ncbi:hypothetical protein SDC9_33241 [bioreactor metagenome]|uniref:AAA domain-containing protein n=1 Tax=bioreactor metagenome TaxID=1076179 RepID=A0A644V904_9ZZZZ|nr:AAA family ATPase [Candidatus Elulimicrobiales bacterium]